MLYRAGLAYQAEALVNYDPVDKTVLANEQVDSSGRSWRSGAVVEQKLLKQWFFRITAYQEALLDDLKVLAEDNRWPHRVIQQQHNWIGKSEGAAIKFRTTSDDVISVFTTRPDTLYGVQFLALSFSHPLVQRQAQHDPELRAFLNRRAFFAPDSKDGYQLKIRATNPTACLGHVSVGDISIYAAPYVLDGYGEGAVMGVPAHDTRDWAFWKQNRPGEDILFTIKPNENIGNGKTVEPYEAYTEPGYLTHHCGKFANMQSADAARAIVRELEREELAAPRATWRLRDWLISRQRYWGTPIPIIHCDTCGPVPVPESELPVTLPKLPKQVQGTKGNPLDSIEEFVNCKCPKCDSDSRRETDTMDTFVDSSWYYARFLNPQNPHEPFNATHAQQWLPVDIYAGGVEHAILHLLYARFIWKVFCSEGLVPDSDMSGGNNKRAQAARDKLRTEPFSRLIAQGMVHGKTYSDPETGRFLKPDELRVDSDGVTPIIKTNGQVATITYEKMSKSKYNGVDPQSCFDKYGADVTKAHMLFAAPLSEVLQWDESKIVGIQRWFHRISRLIDDLLATTEAGHIIRPRDIASVTLADAEILKLADITLQNVGRTLEQDVYGINTVVSDLIKLTNALYDSKVGNLTPWVAQQAVSCLVRMLAPIAPAFAAQCSEDMRELVMAAHSRLESEQLLWPARILSDEESRTLNSLQQSKKCAVQINGKLRFTVDIPVPQMQDGKIVNAQEYEDQVVSIVLDTEPGQLWLKERNDWDKRKKVILVGNGKLLNVVF